HAPRGILALSLLASGLWWVAQQPEFTADAIHAVGVVGYGLNDVYQLTVSNTVLAGSKGNFLTVRPESVCNAIATVPWVRKASVKREWVNQLVVTIEEHRPLGTWGEQGKLVSVKGDVFTANLAEDEEGGRLSELSGPAGSEKEVVARFYDLRTWLSPI